MKLLHTLYAANTSEEFLRGMQLFYNWIKSVSPLQPSGPATITTTTTAATTATRSPVALLPPHMLIHTKNEFIKCAQLKQQRQVPLWNTLVNQHYSVILAHMMQVIQQHHHVSAVANGARSIEENPPGLNMTIQNSLKMTLSQTHAQFSRLKNANDDGHHSKKNPLLSVSGTKQVTVKKSSSKVKLPRDKSKSKANNNENNTLPRPTSNFDHSSPLYPENASVGSSAPSAIISGQHPIIPTVMTTTTMTKVPLAIKHHNNDNKNPNIMSPMAILPSLPASMIEEKYVDLSMRVATGEDEQLYIPVRNIAKIMKQVLPKETKVKITDEAKGTITHDIYIYIRNEGS
jgi:hypothetical protein